MEFTPALFSTRVGSGNRTFFFDVKNTKNAKPYLKITESSISKEGEKKKFYMTVFGNELTEFQQALEQAIDFTKQLVK